MTGRNRRAFTLIELLIVILIIAVMGSLVVPAFTQFWARTRFDGTLQEVRDLFAYARERAITNDTTTQVTFDARSQMLLLTVTPTLPQSDQPVALLNEENPSALNGMTMEEPRTLHIGSEFAISQFTPGGGTGGNPGPQGGGNPVGGISFRGDGTSDGGQITLVSDTGYTAHLVVWAAAGRLTVEDQ